MLALDDSRTLTARDGTPFSVRRLRRGDATALQRFNDELSAPSRRWFLPHPYDAETLAHALRRSEAGEDLLLGLFAGTRLVGYFFLWYVRRRVPLLGIGLVDDLHGRGLGRPLLELLIEQGREVGCEAIELTTMTDNERAYALYLKVGFEHFKDVENLQGNGQWVIERAMIYRFRPDAVPMVEPHRPPV